MRCGIVLPFFDAPDVASCAELAESSGWDGVFLAESVWGVDAWVALTAAAMRTSSLLVGTMLTPLPRFKPWDVASKVGTLDRLSGGRVRLGVGLGALHPGWTAFEPDQGRAERALLLDEGLAVYDGLMRGQPFSFEGRRYQVRATDFYPPPPTVQQPRVPVWVVGAYPREVSLRRAARWDGLLPNIVGDGEARGPASPAELAEVVAEVRRLREAEGLPWEGYDVIAEGVGPVDVGEWAAAGATWWIESDWETTPDAVRDRIAAGPPR
ncbi:alkanesulfonate monooxygenase SsuD/methylene tetrahydromethanopterin reductase-like flavin-dependent oxidoreductase (luciferase family) [Saccharothrix tamanrassetensis]|uniref:Alkanesulfonate monooxygenase SsuD/methylene tetrahydromethanopterin reductase-like flavin-dependent oxidoreductase (Luciferase family) n=1 Tax=Saccharothrix tamanrassetensis TaxID=1051531 RepID=A0A841CTV7_9PSEU|nr:LLM class flavin-dependent oxidoreductase [Saccharothrix tamanrassetensis]MBB5959385.1 alkanesulfonate monooxygenase SsuD/methylene tetrahydromethanopterin reductase-like flavin-dependent oxidoreductase (luciferase family) [Saccharothrix tamanrassetensis]